METIETIKLALSAGGLGVLVLLLVGLYLLVRSGAPALRDFAEKMIEKTIDSFRSTTDGHTRAIAELAVEVRTLREGLNLSAKVERIEDAIADRLPRSEPDPRRGGR